MNKKEIIEFYKRYKNQILNEMKEYLDMPLKNIKKLDDYNFLVYEDDIEAKFNFKHKSFSIFNSSNYSYFPEDTDKTYEISWSFSMDFPQNKKTSKNFLRILATSYKVLNEFIQNKNPNVITFSGLSKGHESIYYGDTFLKRLKTLFGDEYDVVINKENSIIYIINKTISLVKNEAIYKRSKQTNIQESITYWKYPHLHPQTPNNIKIKNKIKNKIIKNLYL
jgi:hypothetical protein